MAGRKRVKSETLAISLALARSLLKRTLIGAFCFFLWPAITVSAKESNLLAAIEIDSAAADALTVLVQKVGIDHGTRIVLILG